MTVVISKELSQMLHTNVRIGKVNLGLLNRIIVDDMLVDDQSGKQLLKVTRLSAKFELKSILEGKISINSVQLFGFTAQLNKQTPQSASNFKFVIDAFAPKDTIKTESNINLRINSILIRRGKVSYDVLSEEETPGTFNPNHLEVHNIIANLSLKALTPDSLNMGIKRLSFDEQSGFSLKKLKLKLIANRKKAQIEHFTIDFPESSIQMGNISLMYSAPDAFEHIADKVAFSMRILPTSYVTLKDISSFVPALKNFKEPIWLDLQARGTINQLSCPRFALSTEDRTFSLSAEGSGQNLTHPEETYIFG
ncbi:MAG: translocation/assembly module TamB, partial [Bacteroides sp.]